ncbi:serine/threonine-protein phosphatase 6 regulatory ankyrin repeat subunit B-like [Belonocnema kinseyi]|uniref:serine/threonine-protein phosphatase 6 regulatory ankyrin repeat subunit B-like n=1 Tax=Belonocnema kinseyi TaxID=2817044 RepID=UPI00143D15E9|nr:serine/threonine-protein phosphatase 6 regulatory ankyrin repeat subunit B-like [Belonocnema kinseyi]
MNSDFDLSAVNPKGETLLHVAAQKGKPKIINALITRGAKIEAVSTSASHIWFRTRNKKARLNSSNQGGRTALHVAALNNNPENVKCLLDAGACVNSLTTEKNTPLHYAVAVENFEIVEMIVKKGADVNALSYYSSPLQVACGSICYVKLKQQQYFEFNSIYYKKFFHKQGIASSYIYNSRIVTFLLNHGANIEEISRVCGTALEEYCYNGNLEIAKILLSSGANPNRSGNALLYNAVLNQDLDIIRLISKHVDVNQRRPYGIPLHWVASTPCITSEDIVDILMEHGANIHAKDDRREESALRLAVLNQNKAAILRRLLKFNANIDAYINWKGQFSIPSIVHILISLPMILRGTNLKMQ